MLKRLRSLSTAHAMVLLTIWGILAVLAYSGARIGGDLILLSDLKRDTRLTEMTGQIGDLTHALQRERGASTGFVASQGGSFRSELRLLREESDVRIAELTSAVSELPQSDEVMASGSGT